MNYVFGMIKSWITYVVVVEVVVVVGGVVVVVGF